MYFSLFSSCLTDPYKLPPWSHCVLVHLCQIFFKCGSAEIIFATSTNSHFHCAQFLLLGKQPTTFSLL